MGNRPVIGISGNITKENCYSLNHTYFDVILEAGGLPVLLPVTADPAVVEDMLDALDGVVLAGGVDIHPSYFGEEVLPGCGEIDERRDAFELLLTRRAIERGMPLLGICRGVQVLNVALGGTLYQDIDTEVSSEHIAHRQKQPFSYVSHPVDVVPGTLLHRVLGTERVMVNSLHHQAIHRPGAWKVCALAPDGLVEAAELPGHPFFLGVQWHPEQLQQRDAASWALFSAFVDACACAKA